MLDCDAATASLGRRRRRRQDGSRASDRSDLRRGTRSLAMLRWARSVFGRIRLELREAIARDSCGRGERSRSARSLLRRFSRAPTALTRTGSRSRERRGALDRRDRSCRRRIRSISARISRRLRDDHPRTRPDRGDARADRDPHVEPYARPARCAEATLLLPLDRAPELGTRGRDHPHAPAERRPRACRERRARGRGVTRAGPAQAAGRRGGARLDADARRARRDARGKPLPRRLARS
jgi:hypothetical protein